MPGGSGSLTASIRGSRNGIVRRLWCCIFGLTTPSRGGIALGARREAGLALGRTARSRRGLDSAHEALDLTGRVHDPLLSCVERMTNVTKIGTKRRLR